jgi:hypothetical protein
MQVEDDAAFAHGVSDDAVAAAAHRELDAGFARIRDDARDVLRVLDARDRRRTLVDAAVEDRAGLVVVGIVRKDHAAGYALEPGDRCRAHAATPPMRSAR